MYMYYSSPKTLLFLCFLQGTRAEIRRIPVPPHRYGPLKEKWLSIYTPVVEQLHLQMRFELRSRNVEIKVYLLSHNTICVDIF